MTREHLLGGTRGQGQEEAVKLRRHFGGKGTRSNYKIIKLRLLGYRN